MIEIRAATGDDKNFIYSTWIKGVFYGCEPFSLIPYDVFCPAYQQVIDRVLERATAKVATLADDPAVILGYSITEPGLLHWVYVKRAWRKMGIAKALIEHPVSTVTHVTELSREIMKNKPYVYNPFLI